MLLHINSRDCRVLADVCQLTLHAMFLACISMQKIHVGVHESTRSSRTALGVLTEPVVCWCIQSKAL